MSATVAVLGPGAVGGALAVRLTLAGSSVVCVARPAAARAIARDGLTLRRGDESLRARPAATERLLDPVDLLLVTPKAFGLEEALDRVEPGSTAGGLALALLNGVEHMDVLRRRLGDGVAAGTIGRLEAYRTSPTEVVQPDVRTPLVVAASDSVGPAELERALDVLRRAGLEVRAAASEAEALWEKAARLAPLAALTSATQLPLGELLGNAEIRGRLKRAVEEAYAVAVAAGAPVTFAAEWEMIESMPATLTTSTARDVAAGRPSEADAIVGGVVRAGRRLGVPCPTLEALLAELPRAGRRQAVAAE